MRYVKKVYFVMVFILYYFYKLVEANLVIAHDILTPRMYTQPGIMHVPVSIQSKLGLLMFTNLLSMTPGNLVIDLSEDRKRLKVHVIYVQRQERILREINEIQRQIQRITG